MLVVVYASMPMSEFNVRFIYYMNVYVCHVYLNVCVIV